MQLQLQIEDRIALDRDIDVLVRRGRRKTLALYVYPGGRVELRAPHRAPWPELQQFITSRRDWIRKKHFYFAARPPKPDPTYGHGDPHSYLGEEIRLDLHQRTHGEALLTDGALTLPVSDPADTDAVRRRLHRWYRDQAERIFGERMEIWAQHLAEFGIWRPTMSVRRMKSRWGSCSRRGHISLNILLVEKPLPLIDVVIVHELCHLVEFNHSPRFRWLMAQVLPDWRERERTLNRRD